jgi:hypothetical protein
MESMAASLAFVLARFESNLFVGEVEGALFGVYDFPEELILLVPLGECGGDHLEELHQPTLTSLTLVPSSELTSIHRSTHSLSFTKSSRVAFSYS